MFVLPNRVMPTSGVRQANAADQPVRKRTDHSGLSPHKAHTPGVKKILLGRGLETPSVPRSDALSALLARPNRAHSSDRGRALPRRRVTKRVDCLRPRESLIGHVEIAASQCSWAPPEIVCCAESRAWNKAAASAKLAAQQSRGEGCPPIP